MQLVMPAQPAPGEYRHKYKYVCEDQILRLSQSISDGYKATMPKKIVLAILDYSSAFDRVWGEDLLIRAIHKGLAITNAPWLRDFLSIATGYLGQRKDPSSPNESFSQKPAWRTVSSPHQTTKLALYGQIPNKQITLSLVLARRLASTP